MFSFRQFHATSLARVAIGDKVPSVDLFENNPGNKVSDRLTKAKHPEGNQYFFAYSRGVICVQGIFFVYSN